MKSFYVNTTGEIDIISIIHEVRGTLRDLKVQEGFVAVMSPQAGAAFAMLRVESKKEDLKKSLLSFRDNGLLEVLLPRSFLMPVSKGRLSTDPWQDLFLIDFETKSKRREFQVSIFSDAGKASEKDQPEPL